MNDYLKDLREEEARRAMVHFRPGARILEIGAGPGWQAAVFAAAGFDVTALDVDPSFLGVPPVFPVASYDGKRIPFPDASFDAVYSSNVLEHVPWVEELLRETHRVLKPGGRAVHALPTPAWRLWTSLAHYVSFLKSRRPVKAAASPEAPTPAPRGFWRRIRSLAAAERHGERGNLLTEAYYFSRSYWSRLFEKTGFALLDFKGGGLFYTGYVLWGSGLTLSARTVLARVLGSGSAVYVMEKTR